MITIQIERTRKHTAQCVVETGKPSILAMTTENAVEISTQKPRIKLTGVILVPIVSKTFLNR